MITEKTTPLLRRSARGGDAEFIGWQKTSAGESLALYNVIVAGHPSFGSTVTEEGLRKLNLETPGPAVAQPGSEGSPDIATRKGPLDVTRPRGLSARLDSKQGRLSYSIGLSIGAMLVKDSVTFDAEALLRGVLDARLDVAHRFLSTGQVKAALAAFQDDCSSEEIRQSERERDKNGSAGQEFLDNNAKRQGVVSESSGLQYLVISEGVGEQAMENSTVEFHYSGRLIDGTLFDSSHDGGRPVRLRVDSVIRGWKEAFQLMSAGSKLEICLPPSLAFGEKGADGIIPPNATLVFEIELLSIS